MITLPDRPHVESVLSWVLRERGRMFTLIPDSSSLRLVIPGADNRRESIAALTAAGYELLHCSAVAHITLYRSPAVAAEPRAGALAVDCPLCGGLFTVPADADGTLIDCAYCPWKGSAVNSW